MRKIFDVETLETLPIGSVLRHPHNGELVEIRQNSLEIGGYGQSWEGLNYFSGSPDFPMELLYRPDVDIATKRVDSIRLAEAMRDSETNGTWVISVGIHNDEAERYWEGNYRLAKRELEDPARLGWAIDKTILDLAKKIEENNDKDQTPAAS
jgi:hypothetical protein